MVSEMLGSVYVQSFFLIIATRMRLNKWIRREVYKGMQ